MKSIDLIKCRFFEHAPFILIHLITSKCNCKCKICNLWKNTSEYINDLSTVEIFSLLEAAHKAGISHYIAMGGEPLMREDLPIILQYAKKLHFTTAVVTNGFLLKERCCELIPFTDMLEVSIDANDYLHDEMRGVEGILGKSIQGIKVCKNSKTKIIINSVISNANLNRINDLLKLSRELDVSISFQPIDIISEYNEYLQLKNDEIRRTFSQIIQFKKEGYRIVNSTQYLQNFSNKKQYVCHGPKCIVTVKPNGDIVSCLNYLFFNRTWGNVKNVSLHDVFENKDFKKFCKDVEKCNDCNDACVIEASLAYSLNLGFLIEKLRN